MMKMTRLVRTGRLCAVALGVLVGAAGAVPASAQIRLNFDLGIDGPCFPTAEAVLAQAGYPPDSIRRTFDVPRYRNRQDINGWQVWSRPASCDGWIIIDFDTVTEFSDNCRVVQIWTRGQCPVPVPRSGR